MKKLHYGLLDIEMTCDGKQENGKFIDDGRMKRSQREIISVGFVVCDDKYNIKNRYYKRSYCSDNRKHLRFLCCILRSGIISTSL